MTKELLGEIPAAAFPFFSLLFPSLPLAQCQTSSHVPNGRSTLSHLSLPPLACPGLRPDLRYFSLPLVFLHTHDIPRMYGLP